MNKDRDQRPASAEALADMLAALELDESWTDEDAQQWWLDEMLEVAPWCCDVKSDDAPVDGKAAA